MSPVFNLNEAGTCLLLWLVNKWPIPNQGRKGISPFSWACVCVCVCTTSLKSALQAVWRKQAVWRGPIPKHNHIPQDCKSYKASVLTVDACPQIHTHVCSSQVLKEGQARCNTSASTQQKITQTPLLPVLNQTERDGRNKQPSEISGSCIKSKSLKLELLTVELIQSTQRHVDRGYPTSIPSQLYDFGRVT